jgi:hypothetical protein
MRGTDAGAPELGLDSGSGTGQGLGMTGGPCLSAAAGAGEGAEGAGGDRGPAGPSCGAGLLRRKRARGNNWRGAGGLRAVGPRTKMGQKRGRLRG